MTQESSLARDLALRVLRHEGATGDANSEAIGAAADRALRRLQANLTRWFGPEGFNALLARALDRARPGCPPLASVTVQLNGESAGAHLLDGLFDSLRSRSPVDAMDAFATVIAAMIALLGRLVGDDVALRLVEQSWQDELRATPHFTDERIKE